LSSHPVAITQRAPCPCAPSLQVVVVRDDLLARWGQSKLSVMISSALLGLYKRVYKSRDLRTSLLAWVRHKAALPPSGAALPPFPPSPFPRTPGAPRACRSNPGPRHRPAPAGAGRAGPGWPCRAPPCPAPPRHPTLPSRPAPPRPAPQEAQKAAKVVLRCPDEAALVRLMDAARAAEVPSHSLLELVPGSGPDEAPSRTRAILALGPASHSALAAAGCQALPAL
jgi:peptidyl-tRNA hydrolase